MTKGSRIISVFFILLLCLITGTGCIDSGDGLPAQLPESMTGTNAASNIIEPTCTPVTITQTDGTMVTIPCTAKRIIAANSNAAELLIAMGAGDRIVGVTDSTGQVPYIMDKIPRAESIGDWQTPNIERILALHPDVVIAYSSSKPKNIDQITAANITIIALDCYRLSTLASDARALGQLTGKTDEAEIYAKMVEKTIGEVTERVETIPPDGYPSVYMEMYTDYTAASAGSGANELVTGAGGNNIASDTTGSSVKISPEWVVAEQPDYIFKVVSTANAMSLEEIVNSMKERPGWDTIQAVEKQHIYAFANDIVYGPRAYIGLVHTAQILHPDMFDDMHPEEMLEEYDRKYVTGTFRTGMIYP